MEILMIAICNMICIYSYITCIRQKLLPVANDVSK